MKRYKYKFLIMAFFTMTVSFSAVNAQDETPTDATQQNFNQARRPNLLTELDLSQEQIRQIRRINADKKPLLREAQQKVREANRNLDQAIYADESNETEIQARLKAVQLAQAEVIKIRSSTEFAVRRVLNPNQLVKFREIRQMFTERMESVPNARNNRPLNAPNRKLFNRGRKQRPND